MTGLFLFNFETTLSRNHFTQIWSKSVQRSGYRDIVIFMFSAILVTAESENIGMSNCKNYNGFMQETFWYKVGSTSIIVFEMLSFSCLLSMPMGIDYVVIGFDIEVQPLVTHNAA